MYQTVNEYQFEDMFNKMGRENQFSYNGKRALYQYLLELEEDSGTQIELDVVALCVDFTEYPSAIEAASVFKNEFTSEEEALEYLQDNTSVISFDGGVIIQDY